MSDTLNIPDQPTACVEWPDGQVREEQPYRCGAFRVLGGEQCRAWSDHAGEHVFAGEIRTVAAREICIIATYEGLREPTRAVLRRNAELLDLYATQELSVNVFVADAIGAAIALMEEQDDAEKYRDRIASLRNHLKRGQPR